MQTNQSTRKIRVVIVVDTPNITKSIIGRHGQPARPNYKWLIKYAQSIGYLEAAVALVNDGVNPAFSDRLRKMGYQVEPSHAFDCDDAIVAWTVRLYSRADRVIICSGDHTYCDLVCLLRAAKRQIIVCAVDGACNYRLRGLSDQYVEVPCYMLRERPGAPNAVTKSTGGPVPNNHPKCPSPTEVQMTAN
jgi:hypothetical protein